MPSLPSQTLRRRLLQALALGCVLAFLSGCVYLRLLRFKNQLANFDQHVAIESVDGLALRFAPAIVRDADFVFITESEPTAVNVLSEQPRVEEWLWDFEKRLPADDEQARPFIVTFRTRFEDGLLTEIEFDPQLLEAIPSDFVVELFRSMGKARINKFRRSATAVMNRDMLEDVPLPSMNDIALVMGEPTEKKRKKQRRLWRYVFNFYNPQDRSLSGQFAIIFKTEAESLDSEIFGFEVTGKGR